jgi:DNA-binding response OmpR family regulator
MIVKEISLNRKQKYQKRQRGNERALAACLQIIATECGISGEFHVSERSRQVFLVSSSTQVFSSHQFELLDQAFSPHEWALFQELVHAYPRTVTYERLLASISSRDRDVTTIQRHLQEAKGHSLEQFEREVTPVRETIKSLKRKCQRFHLTIGAVRLVGYALTSLSPPRGSGP